VGTIRYSDEGTGVAIVFLHGTLSNSNTWRKVIPTLSHHFRCIAPTLPLGAHSVPLAPSADLTPPGIAALLLQFMDTLGLDKVILVGNDTGGAYAQVFTMNYPDRVAALVLCNTDALEVFPPKQFALLKAGISIPGFTFLMAQLFRIKPLLKTSFALGLLSHTLSKEDLHDLYVHFFIQQRGVRADFTKVVKSWSPQYTLLAAEKLSTFNKPVFVIWGADDTKLFPVELGRRVCDIFPDARFEVVENSLTYVQEDQPELFVSKLIQFIESIHAS
jgi:pimeloyl-ACP methyl ester carboxylesterase